MSASTMAACLVCGGAQWTTLPDPGPRSMTTDLRVVEERLARAMCTACGLMRRAPYAASAPSAGDSREEARHDEFARWIAQGTGRRPRTVLDVACGDGSLLRALRAYWPDAAFLGCDGSRENIAQGFGTDLTLWTGTASNLPGDLNVDLVIAVNVIERAADPIAFLTAVRAVLQPDGLLVIVCPDGGRPGLDLLCIDRVFSFGREHLGTLLSRGRLQRLGASQAPRSLGAFQMAIARPRDVKDTKAIPAPARLDDVKRYLEKWRQLDERLKERISGLVVCAGAGEAAGLLRAYAPRTWAAVRACAIEGAAQGRFGELPIMSLDDLAADATVLAGVRPGDQPRLAERLAPRVGKVVTWYDLVDEQAHV